jgi:hypothetical protein
MDIPNLGSMLVQNDAQFLYVGLDLVKGTGNDPGTRELGAAGCDGRGNMPGSVSCSRFDQSIRRVPMFIFSTVMAMDGGNKKGGHYRCPPFGYDALTATAKSCPCISYTAAQGRARPALYRYAGIARRATAPGMPARNRPVPPAMSACTCWWHWH